MSRYAIWDKMSPIITPAGEVFTAEQWMIRYPVAAVDSIKIVCAGGIVNGAFFGIFDSMVSMFESRGCDFSGCVTDQDKLDAIEAFESAPAAEEVVSNEELTATSLASIAASLEYQNMLTLEDVEVTE